VSPIQRLSAAIVFLLTCGAALAGTPAPGAPLPELAISDRGELVMNGGDFAWQPWSSTASPGKVHVIQYFGATMGDRDVFAAFTDRLQVEFEPGTVHVTTVLNMDAAMWGTSGMVISELEKNKKMHPDATMVVDEQGSGVSAWDLGKAGTGLVLLDAGGKVLFFTRGSLDAAQMGSTIELIKANLGA